MMHEKSILRVVSKILIPAIILYAFYVQFHGDFGPGGGFQAGVIMATAFILYALIFGIEPARKVIPAWFTRLLLSAGVLLYAGTGVLSMVMGGEFLNYSVLAHDALHGQHWGIFAVELGVGMTVTGAIITIFYTFAAQLPSDNDEEGQA